MTTNGSEALTQAEQANKTQSDGMPSEANQVAEEMNHELPVGSEVGEQQLAEQSGESEELAAMMRLDRMQIRTVSRIQNRQHQMKWQRLQVRQALYP